MDATVPDLRIPGPYRPDPSPSRARVPAPPPPAAGAPGPGGQDPRGSAYPAPAPTAVDAWAPVPDATVPDLLGGRDLDEYDRDRPAGKPRRRRRSYVLAASGVAVAVAAGVTMIVLGWHRSGPPQPPAAKSVRAPAPTVSARPLGRALPVRIKIPRIDVDAPVEQLGLNADGTVQVPPLTEPNLAGWYKGGPTPGQRGAAVILGHVDAHHSEAVFFRLGSLRTGDHINVTRRDRSVAKFVVDKVVPVLKDKFPTKSVYGKTRYPALRVITCGGKFDTQTKHYLSNIIVYAHLVP